LTVEGGHGVLYSQDDVIEIGGDGVPRIVSNVAGDQVTFDPDWDNPAADTPIMNWVRVDELDDVTTATGTTSTIIVDDGSKYHENDLIEIAGDGEYRIVTEVVEDTVTFTDGLGSPSTSGTSVYRWSLVPETDMDGEQRRIGPAVDIGADEASG